MSILQALALGAVQGLTEFIPISSSGHLVVVPAALGWDKPSLAFDVMLHVASLVALLAYFAGDLLDLTRGARAGDRDSRRLALLLALGTVPAALAGLVLGGFFEESFEDAPASAVQLVVTAVILVGAELALRYHERRVSRSGARLRRINELNAGDAGIIGVAQAVSILPGISRSGATIAAGLGLAIARDDAARFGFLLAIPALAGAAVVQLPQLGAGGPPVGLGAGLVGFVASLITSYAAIWGLIRYLRTRTLYPFALYCVLAGIFFYAVV
ncbi:MAG: undecaprenyl-diphosphate phosphatase [Actinomycetota bacterium]